VGTRVVFEGPFGRLTDSVRRNRKMTMIASGIGITPLRALLEEADYRPGQAVLLYRASAPTTFLFRRELDALAIHRGVRVVYLPGPRMRDRRSWLPRHYAGMADGNALLYLVPDINEHDVFICGPDAWTEAVIASARRAGVPAEQVHTERFAW
jgi:ferredoxin-NADP reductase